jgi:hypothetical protein
MLQAFGKSHAVLQKYFKPATLAVFSLLLIGNAAWADDFNQGRTSNEAGDDRGTRLIKTIPVPVSSSNNTAGAMYSYDISWVDQARQLYFLADRSNKAVDVVDAKTDTFLKQITPSGGFAPFAGFTPCAVQPAGANDCAGPNGVVTAEPPYPWLFVTDAPSRLVCFNFQTGATISQVTLQAGEPTRADELAYSPQLGLILAINNAASPPFGTWVKVDKSNCGLTVLNHIVLNAAHGVDATNGAEQPVWEPDTGRFYLSIPEVSGPGGGGPNGAVIRLAPNATTVEAVFPIQYCQPAGLTVGPRQDLFIGCNTVFGTDGKVWDPNGTITAAPKDVIIDAKTGKKDPSVLDANVYGVGAGDEVWFNKGDGNYYATGSGSPFRPFPAATAKGATPLGVVDAKDQKILQQLTTYNVPAGTGHPAGTAHSVAANADNNHIFVPLAANNAFSAFAVPNGGLVPDCEKGCIAVFAHTDEDPGNPKKDD